MSSDTDILVAVVGGGLSGLVAARELQRTGLAAGVSIKVVLLEARDRLGGRILREHNVDLGPSWTWPRHDKALIQLTTELGVSLEEQYVAGKAMLHKSGRAIPFAQNESPAGDGSKRFQGGPSAIVTALEKELLQTGMVDIRLNQVVQAIEVNREDNIASITITNPLSLQAPIKVLGVNAVVIAIPLQLIANSIHFNPPLPIEQRSLMASTPTWMGNTGKIGFIFKNAFWKKLGMSGTTFSESGPMSQTWDASTADGTVSALSSFTFDAALESLVDPESALAPNSHIRQQLLQLFGNEASNPLHIVHKSWNIDPYTVPMTSTCPADSSTPFGHPGAIRPHHCIVISGTESCPNENGHMNGAVLAGLRAAKEVILILKKKV